MFSWFKSEVLNLWLEQGGGGHHVEKMWMWVDAWRVKKENISPAVDLGQSFSVSMKQKPRDLQLVRGATCRKLTVKKL